MKNLVTILLFIIISTFIVSSYAIDPKIIVAIWLLDENKGNVIEDSSGNGHQGEIQGSVKWIKGKFSSALEFPGKGDSYVLIPHDEAFNLTTFSITAWINLKDTGAYHGLVEKVEGGTRNFYMAIYPNDKVFYGGFRANNAWNNALTKTPVLDEKWHYLAVTYDQKDIRGYVDGILEDEKSFNLKPELNNGPVTIGVTGAGGAEPTLGLIDEVGIFNDALAANDVNNIMKNGLERAVMAVKPSGKLAVTWGRIKRF
ncbi:LamG domain-containing protein [Candidatus Poribacteria bacterium]|nr:LamG domain-containing protein [Candidatus Poribacteria bacterium]